MGQMCVTDTRQFPVPPVSGVPIPRDWLERMKLFATALFQTFCNGERIYWLIRCLKSVEGTPTLTEQTWQQSLSLHYP